MAESSKIIYFAVVQYEEPTVPKIVSYTTLQSKNPIVSKILSYAVLQEPKKDTGQNFVIIT